MVKYARVILGNIRSRSYSRTEGSVGKVLCFLFHSTIDHDVPVISFHLCML